ncbi:fra a 1-associated protein [Apium graveolens]|uniref:fra a 1-associated protein n=1 Tax=Apium graveolens TaxID=4045 RepID=UPI003D7A698B
MGWVWQDDVDDSTGDKSYGQSSVSENRCYTKKIVSSNCKTEEVEPGKFIRKCQKTEQLIKDCVGRPSEVVQSNKEYTEEDITDQVVKGSFSTGSSPCETFSFPGLRSDIDAIEKGIFSSMHRFFDVAEEMRNGFFSAFGTPHIYDRETQALPSARRGIPIEGNPAKETSPKPGESDGHVDLSGMAKDV